MFPGHEQAHEAHATEEERIDQSLYWYPDELAVTVQASAPPTLRQLRDLSKRLQRLLSRVGISILPFYAGGQRLTRQAGRPGIERLAILPARPAVEMVEAEGLEVGDTPAAMQVEKRLHFAWREDVERCRSSKRRFPGVHAFGQGPKGVAVVLYALHTHHQHPGEQHDLTRIAVNLINQNLLDLAPHTGEEQLLPWKEAPRALDALLADINPEDPSHTAHQQRLRVLAAMPNWLTGPAQFGKQPPTGPGAPPMEAPPVLEGRWEFVQEPFKKLLAEPTQPDAQVTVIILDTSYKDEQVAALRGEQEVINATDVLLQRQHNYLLKLLRDHLQNGFMAIDTSATTIATSFRSGLDEYGQPYGYMMVDHGIFVAGIILGILPLSKTVKIELIRIENDYGSGEMDLFLGALAAISARPRSELEHVVLNLSLGVLPPLEQLQELWFGSGCCCEGGNAHTISQSLDMLHLGVRLPIQTLIEQGVVIVAAAGNDSLGKNPPLGPRIPARYEGVLGVAAVDRDYEAADYSNRANSFDWGTGIATYGGEQPNDDTETLARLVREQRIYQPTPDDLPDAVCGLYLYPTFPALNVEEQGPSRPNEYGWAWWSGTSFATPIVSALAAQYILRGLRGQQVVQAILKGLADDTQHFLYNTRLQAPVLKVKQR